MSSDQNTPDRDTRRTPEVRSVGSHLAPRHLTWPPVDSVSQPAFGRPPGFAGSFPGADNYRGRHEYTPRDTAPGPALAEAFGPAHAAA
ncbi:MAG: hypothetical protein ACRDTN_16540, partial [Mycobacterium sp.]